MQKRRPDSERQTSKIRDGQKVSPSMIWCGFEGFMPDLYSGLKRMEHIVNKGFIAENLFLCQK